MSVRRAAVTMIRLGPWAPNGRAQQATGIRPYE